MTVARLSAPRPSSTESLCDLGGIGDGGDADVNISTRRRDKHGHTFDLKYVQGRIGQHNRPVVFLGGRAPVIETCAWEECETAYQPDRMVECYERLKGRGDKGATVFNPLGTGLTYAIMERATEDKIPVLTMGYGRTDASDGRVWPYLFPLIVNYWNQSTAKIAYIASREGGYENLKGLKIANLLHDSAYGKETHTVLEAQAEKYGFEVAHFPVAHPGLDQKATWLQISRRFKPDWVILRGWGVMCSTAIKEAARINFPREKMIGVWWCGSEEDVVAAGSAAKGYVTTTFHAPGADFPVIGEIMEHVHDKGNGNIDTERVGSIYYNRGVVQAILTTEAIRTAMGKFGDRAVSGEEVQWGLENLDITAERIKEIGAEGLVSPHDGLEVVCGRLARR